MDNLAKVEVALDIARVHLRDAQELLSLIDPRQAAIGGGLSVIEVGLSTVLEVLEHLIANK